MTHTARLMVELLEPISLVTVLEPITAKLVATGSK